MQFIRSRSTKYKGYVKEMEKRKRIEINGTERERDDDHGGRVMNREREVANRLRERESIAICFLSLL